MSPGGFQNWSWAQFGKSLGIGAISGVATFGIGEVFGATGTFMNEVGRGLSHGVVQGGSSVIQGGDFGDFLSGFASGAIGSWVGHGVEQLGITKTTGGLLAYSSVSAGVSSWATGGNFWEGAANGLMVAGLNQVLHKVATPSEQGEIRKRQPNSAERVKESSLAGEIAYSMVDDSWITLQCLAGVENIWHLDGSGAVRGSSEVINAGVMTSASLVGSVAGAATKGLKVVNASQFNRMNAGTSINSAAKGGQYIRHSNNAVRSAQAAAATGSNTLKYTGYTATYLNINR